MGRLVQQPPPARTYRERASRRGGSALLCPGRGTGLGRLTQAKPPPRNPVRFTPRLNGADRQVAWAMLEAARDERGVCYLASATLAKLTGLHDVTVRASR